MIYLASPYSDPNPAVCEDRVCAVAAEMMREGELVFCPIAHTHPIGLPKGWDYWQRLDHWFLDRCDKVIVLMLAGWEVSHGVTAEITYAKSLGKVVEYKAWQPS